MRKRATLLLMVIGIAVGIAACGRASQADIYRALGITPTPTLSAADRAATAQAAVAAATRAAAAAGAGGGPVGNAAQGATWFNVQCAGCHQPGGGGTGPDLTAKGGPGAAITYDKLLTLIRSGTGHTPPGPYSATDLVNGLSDQQVADLTAYLHQQAGS